MKIDVVGSAKSLGGEMIALETLFFICFTERTQFSPFDTTNVQTLPQYVHTF